MDTSRSSAWLLTAALLAPAAALAQPQGAFLNIDDARLDERIGVSYGGIGAAVFQNDDGFANIAVGSFDVSEASPTTFSVSWTGPSEFSSVPSQRVYFLEPGTLNISDILDYSVDYTFTDFHQGTFSGSFTSDNEGSLGTLPVELAQNESTFDESLGAFTLGFPGFSFSAISDTEAVPEASTYAAGAFLAGLIGWRCLRSRKAA